MAKINSLTKEQQDLLSVYRDKWIGIGLSVTPTNEKRASALIKEVYQTAGLKPPKHIIFRASPLDAWTTVCILKKYPDTDLSKPFSQKLIKECIKPLQYSEAAFGQHDANWLGFYNYFLEVLKIEECKKLEPTMRLAEEVSWFFPYENVCIVSEKPVEIHLNKDNKLHNTSGPALKYKDGLAVYALNGIDVPEYIVTTPPDQLDVKKVLGERNVDVRREALRLIPIDRLLKETNAKVLDTWFNPKRKWCNYTLYDMDFKDGKTRRVLGMKNPSIDAFHYERVEDTCKTVKEALAWRMGLTVYVQPSILT